MKKIVIALALGAIMTSSVQVVNAGLLDGLKGSGKRIKTEAKDVKTYFGNLCNSKNHSGDFTGMFKANGRREDLFGAACAGFGALIGISVVGEVLALVFKNDEPSQAPAQAENGSNDEDVDEDILIQEEPKTKNGCRVSVGTVVLVASAAVYGTTLTNKHGNNADAPSKTDIAMYAVIIAKIGIK